MCGSAPSSLDLGTTSPDHWIVTFYLIANTETRRKQDKLNDKKGKSNLKMQSSAKSEQPPEKNFNHPAKNVYKCKTLRSRKTAEYNGE